MSIVLFFLICFDILIWQRRNGLNFVKNSLYKWVKNHFKKENKKIKKSFKKLLTNVKVFVILENVASKKKFQICD